MIINLILGLSLLYCMIIWKNVDLINLIMVFDDKEREENEKYHESNIDINEDNWK